MVRGISVILIKILYKANDISFFLYPEVAAAIIKAGTADKSITWYNFIKERKRFIVEKYDDEPLRAYQGDWKCYFKMEVKNLQYKVLHDDFAEDPWTEVRNEIQKLKNSYKAPSSSSSSSLSFQKELYLQDYDNFEEIYMKISKKWTLKSGRNVEDVMWNHAKDFKFEQ
jgi:hypothetical protein